MRKNQQRTYLHEMRLAGDRVANTYVWNRLYRMGWRQPRYPVPAIRQHFEFGWSLSNNCCVLIHAQQGVYDEV